MELSASLASDHSVVSSFALKKGLPVGSMNFTCTAPGSKSGFDRSTRKGSTCWRDEVGRPAIPDRKLKRNQNFKRRCLQPLLAQIEHLMEWQRILKMYAAGSSIAFHREGTLNTKQ
eukprot:2112646-Rhodomonas_salina.2